jgi:hypothetical protein
MEEFRERDGFVLPVSVKLASGRKPERPSVQGLLPLA